MTRDTNEYDEIFKKYGKANLLDWLLLKAQVKAESNFDPNAKSPVGAMGLAQFMSQTWKEFGEGDPYDPEQSIKAQAKYIRWLTDYTIKQTHKDLIEWVLSAYNWGIGNVKNLIKKTNGDFKKGFDKMPEETQRYVKKILKFYSEYNSLLIDVGAIKQKLPITLDTETVQTRLKPTKEEKEEYEPYFGWCDVEGCENEGCCGGTDWRESGYWTICMEHSKDFREGKPQPKMKPEAIEREKSRDPKTGLLPIRDK